VRAAEMVRRPEFFRPENAAGEGARLGVRGAGGCK